MIKIPFSKPVTTISQQLNLLQSRGLVINNLKRAEHYLETVGYYRLSGYMYPFLKDKKNHVFIPNTTFDQIINTYFFDRELRLLIFSAIEKIEVAFRTQIIYQVSNYLKNPFWISDTNNFKNITSYNKTYADLKKLVSASNDSFIQHFLNTYSEPMPPAWMLAEIMQMGHVSHIFENLKTSTAKQNIGAYFGVPHQVLGTWIHTLVYIRNICAHHSRLWNKILRIKPSLPKKPKNAWISKPIPVDKFYTVFCIIKYLLDIIAPNNHFVEKFEHLLAKYPELKISEMGFDSNWKNEPLFL